MKLPWKIYKENKELEIKLAKLKEKTEEIMKDKYKLAEEIKQYQEWQDNPFSLLKHYGLKLETHNLHAMSKEEFFAYCMQIHDVLNTKAFKMEMESLSDDIRNKILSETTTQEDTERHRILLVFIAGLIRRFNELNAFYLKQAGTPHVVDRNHSVIG